MIKEITVEGKVYTITDEGKYSPDQELVFEIRKESSYSFVVGMWDNILGLPVRKVWKIVGISHKS